MAIAALCLSILALFISVIALTVQLTLAAVKMAPKEEPAKETLELSDDEINRFFSSPKATPPKEVEKINEILETPSYTGLSEEFDL